MSYGRDCFKVINIVGLREPFCNKMGLKYVHRSIQTEFDSIDNSDSQPLECLVEHELSLKSLERLVFTSHSLSGAMQALT